MREMPLLPYQQATNTHRPLHGPVGITPRRQQHRLLSLAKLAAIVCLSLAGICGISVRYSAVYGTHIAGWHQVTVTQGSTLYGYAIASGAGYPMAVEQAIERRNGLKGAEIVAGMTLYVPDKQGVK